MSNPNDPTADHFHDCKGCGRAVPECECFDDEYPEGWEDEGDQDLDADGEPFWCYADKRAGLCCDDLCHGAQRCISEPRPWEAVEDGEEEP